MGILGGGSRRSSFADERQRTISICGEEVVQKEYDSLAALKVQPSINMDTLEAKQLKEELAGVANNNFGSNQSRRRTMTEEEKDLMKKFERQKAEKVIQDQRALQQMFLKAAMITDPHQREFTMSRLQIMQSRLNKGEPVEITQAQIKFFDSDQSSKCSNIPKPKANNAGNSRKTKDVKESRKSSIQSDDSFPKLGGDTPFEIKVRSQKEVLSPKAATEAIGTPDEIRRALIKHRIASKDSRQNSKLELNEVLETGQNDDLEQLDPFFQQSEEAQQRDSNLNKTQKELGLTTKALEEIKQMKLKQEKELEKAKQQIQLIRQKSIKQKTIEVEESELDEDDYGVEERKQVQKKELEEVIPPIRKHNQIFLKNETIDNSPQQKKEIIKT